MSNRQQVPQELIDRADSIDIMEFLRSQGQTIVRDGHEYKWKEHDSVKISPEKNVWYQWSTGKGGGVISLCRTFFGLTFPQAVAFLLNESIPVRQHCPVPAPERDREFRLTQPCPTNDHAVAYLTNVRKISPEILAPFLATGDVYEESYCGNINVVFVGRSPDGVARTATRRATVGGFRRDFPGSDKHFGFSHITDSSDLYVFEAAIELLSFATMFPSALKHNLLAQGGCANYNCLYRFLSDHPNVNRIFLCFNNDIDKTGNPGQTACEHLEQSLPAALTVCRVIPCQGDWNDVLRTGEPPKGKYKVTMRK